MDNEKTSIGFHIRFNWPHGKTSFAGFEINKKITENRLKATVGAKDNESDKFTTFTETKEPMEISQVTKIFSEATSKGRYLTGNFFVITIYDCDNNVLKSALINVLKVKPLNATGPTLVDKNFYLDV